MRLFRPALLLAISIPLIAQLDFSADKEAGLGRQMAADLRRRTTSVEDPEIDNYVNRIGQRLAKKMPDPKSFHFSVITDDPCSTTHEPASLPGGYVFVPARLLIAAHIEAEFAGMLTHAMEHIALRHGTKQATLVRVANPGTMPLIFIGGWAGTCPGHLAVPAGLLPTLHANELESDAMAIQSMAHAGFDPQALVDYIERVEPLPSRNERVAVLNSAIEQLPPSDYIETTSEFLAVRTKTTAYLQFH